MSTWTHSICDDCFSDRYDGQPPTPHRMKEPDIEACCYCGRMHHSGIYVRDDPAQVACGGQHEALFGTGVQ